MSGGNQSKITVTLRNPLDYSDTCQYYIVPHDNPMARDWITALKELLKSNNLIEKNFCFMGFPKTSRNIELLCNELNDAIFQINMFNSSLAWVDAGLASYIIEEYFVSYLVHYKSMLF